MIVRDMWLTGFDAPVPAHDVRRQADAGHGLMQAIARVNRVFRDKPGGLVVDYLGLAEELKQALADYTESGGTGEPAIDTGESRRRDAGEVRDRLRHVPRLRLVEVDDGHARRTMSLLARRPGAHPRPGRRQGTLRPGGDRTIAAPLPCAPQAMRR